MLVSQQPIKLFRKLLVLRNFLLFLIFSFLFLQAIACKEGLAESRAYFLNPDGSKSPNLTLEVADSASSRKLGLMYRKELEQTNGMLFVFPEESKRGFWMKNTYISLDIIYLNSKKEVVSISKDTVPLSQSQYRSVLPSQYVVEIGAGLSKTWGIIKGSRLVDS